MSLPIIIIMGKNNSKIRSEGSYISGREGKGESVVPLEDIFFMIVWLRKPV